ncbi:TRAP transporter large permease [Rhodobium gokarnense]|uniref:TRAP transporter large permease protein n=1 Tax=Rhodobium gokarnense TaxID=364296 RepID=A0ABT3HF45_9HYPH|nr:TRAP transporter large permease subunit [Rhodobium gokarnense]MCW2309023.1 C4-dicarboxylate transporter DctM subunit [Rhodobium gokarnense]
MAATLIILVLGFLAIGMPVAFALWLTGLITVVLFGVTSFTQIAQSIYSGLDSFILLAIPFFILAGNIMLHSGFARYLFDFMQSLVGGIPGGASVGASGSAAVFGAMTGSSVASAAALGRVMIPVMETLGYPRRYTAGLMAAGGTLGLLIPPSVTLVIYGEMAQQSVRDLFIAGVVPGIFAASVISLVGFAIAIRKRYGLSSEAFSFERVRKSFVKAAPALVMPVVVLGGIYSGVFTPTEAAAASVVYGLVVGMLVYRSIKVSDLPRIFVESARGTSSVLFILSGALFVGFLATLAGIPQSIVHAIEVLDLSPLAFLAITSIILIVLGCFLDGFTLLTVVAPLLLPSVVSLGINPIHFAIVLVLNIEIAAITPPIGLNLFVIAGISGTTMQEVVVGSTPFVLALFAVLVVVMLFPTLSLILI